MKPWLLLELFIDFGLPMLLALVGAILLWRAYPHRSKKGTPICPACRYNLTGSTSENCPECGADLTANWRTSFKFTGKKKAVLGAVLVIPMLWVLWMCVSYYSWAVPRHWRLAELQKTQPSGAKFQVVRYESLDIKTDAEPGFWTSPALWVAAKFTDVWMKLLSTPQAPLSPYASSPTGHASYLMNHPGFRLTYHSDRSTQAYEACLLLWQAVTRPNMHYRRYFYLYDFPVFWVKVKGATSADAHCFERLKDLGDFLFLDVRDSEIDGPILDYISRLQTDTLVLENVVAPDLELLRLAKVTKVQNLQISFGRVIQPLDLDAIASMPKLRSVRIITRHGPLGSECDAALARLIRKPGLKHLHVPVINAPHPQTTGALGEPEVKDKVEIKETDILSEVTGGFGR